MLYIKGLLLYSYIHKFKLSALLLCFMIAHSHDDDVLCCTYVVAFRMCKGCKIVLLISGKCYLPVALWGSWSVLENYRKFWNFRSVIFISRRYLRKARSSLWHDRVLEFHFLSALCLRKSHRVKVLNKKIDVLSCENIEFSCIWTKPASSFPIYSRARVEKDFCQLEAFLVCHYLRISRHFRLCDRAWKFKSKRKKWKFLAKPEK